MLEKLKKILFENTDMKEMEITESTNLRTDLKLDSFDMAQLICIVEDEFEVEIPGRTISNLKTVGDLIHFLESK